MRIFIAGILMLFAGQPAAQSVLTPELLWKLGRVSGMGVTKDKKFVIYSVSTPDVASNNSSLKTYRIPVSGGVAEVVLADSN